MDGKKTFFKQLRKNNVKVFTLYFIIKTLCVLKLLNPRFVSLIGGCRNLCFDHKVAT